MRRQKWNMRGFLRRVKGRGGMKIYILIIYILRKCAGFFQLCNDAGGDHCIARRSPTPSNTLQPSQTLPTLQPHDCHWSLQSHLTPLQCHMYEFDVFAIFTWHTIEWLFEPQDIMIKILDGVATFECVEYLTIVILLLYIVVGTITSFYVWQQWSCLLWSKHFVLSLKTHSGEKCHQCDFFYMKWLVQPHLVYDDNVGQRCPMHVPINPLIIWHLVTSFKSRRYSLTWPWLIAEGPSVMTFNLYICSLSCLALTMRRVEMWYASACVNV